MMEKKLSKIFLNLLVFSILVVFSIACAPTEQASSVIVQRAEQEDNQSNNPEDIQFSLEDINTLISHLVQEVMPSVVSIQADVIRDNEIGEEELQQVIGSGIIMNEEGYILTNSHIIADARELIVVLDNGTIVEGDVVGSSIQTDVGVVKIEANDLAPAVFGTMDDQEVGDLVVAVGSPFGIQQTVTLGIISGKERIIPTPADTLPIVDAIQTDAAINPGNSGGPLINVGGEVIGVNTLGISPTGASAGIGFAIPIDTAINIAEHIIEFGEARIPFMGVELAPTGVDAPGVMIENVVEDSPAEKAGLAQGDIILEIEDTEITSPFGVLSNLLRMGCDEEIDVLIERDGEIMEVSVFLELCPVLE